MADQTTNALLGICKTLSDVVAPAVTADDPLAQQELKMAVRYLEFLRERVDQIHARARFELRFDVELARTVHGMLGGSAPVGAALDDAARHGEALLATPGAAIETIRAGIAELTAAMTEAVRHAQGMTQRAAVERAVLEAYEQLTAFERSWYLPLGLDHFASEVAPLESFLANSAIPHTTG